MGEQAAITIHVLPAAYGDCLWVECAGTPPWRLLIDGGPPETWPILLQRIEDLTPAGRRFDLVVASHLDSDHIGGLLPLFAAAPKLGISFGDVWFNGLPQLPAAQNLVTRSVAEGETLMALLTGTGGASPLPWNLAFDGFAAMTREQKKSRVVPIEPGPRLTLLSPTPRRLERLRAVWVNELGKLQRGESEEPAPPAPGGRRSMIWRPLPLPGPPPTDRRRMEAASRSFWNTKAQAACSQPTPITRCWARR
jgi:hypothetical protein